MIGKKFRNQCVKLYKKRSSSKEWQNIAKMNQNIETVMHGCMHLLWNDFAESW